MTQRTSADGLIVLGIVFLAMSRSHIAFFAIGVAFVVSGLVQRRRQMPPPRS